MSTDNEKKSISLKDAKYKYEQDKLYNTMLKKIKYNDETRSFFVDDVDREYVVGDMYNDVKKYHHFDVYGRINMKKNNSHLSLVKKIFVTRGAKLILKNIRMLDENNNKVIKKNILLYRYIFLLEKILRTWWVKKYENIYMTKRDDDFILFIESEEYYYSLVFN